MIFYHASPYPDLEGKALIRKKKLNPASVLREADNKEYACVATSVMQAVFWAKQLKNRSSVFYIYEVEVPDFDVVEDCRGHYRFEKSGKLVPACSVRYHDDYDGEVCLFGDYTVRRKIMKLEFYHEDI